MAAAPVYCLCGKPYDPTRFMIQCDACKEWFHGSCVGLHEHQSIDIEKYHCPKCEKMFGPSISKRRTNWHRQDYSEADAEGKPVQTGTPVFIKELKSRHFPSADEVLLVMRGQQLTLPTLSQSGFNRPILVESNDGLGLVVPPSTFSLEDIERYLGPDWEIDAIDVTRQDDIHMTFNEFVRYFNSPIRTKIINLISLEFSKSRLAPLVEAPYIVNKLSWIQNIWPEQLPENCTFSKPFVQKYCLIGVRDSYTDFHIDFGGTSVWYHVLRGEKVFYLIRPTQANLALYKRWMASSNRSETFFGDQVDACFKCTVKQGQTLLIPTAWIHAVFTPVDSLVFGGNFLHSLNLPLQLQVYDIEKRIKTPDKFRFPWFETCNWYAAKYILEDLKDQNCSDRKPLPYLIQGAKALVSALKSWTQDKEYLKNHKDEIPSNISYTKLLKDLTKEVRNAEKSTQNKKPKLRQLPPRDRRGRVGLRLGEYPQLKEEPVLTNNSTNLNSNHIPPVTATKTKPNLLQDDFDTAYEQSLIKMISEHDMKTREMNPVDPFALPPTHQVIRETASVKVQPLNKPVGSQHTQPKLDESVYEFHDSDDDLLVVDENPRRSTIRKHASKKMSDYGKKQSPLKVKLPAMEVSDLKKSGKQEFESSLQLGTVIRRDIANGRSGELKELKVDVSGSVTKVGGEEDEVLASPKLGGIEELLRASGYASEGAKRATKLEVVDELSDEEEPEPLQPVPVARVEERTGTGTDGDDPFVATNSGRASPSTREAIQGMLSMGLAVQFSSNLMSPSTTLSELQAVSRTHGNRLLSHAGMSPLKHPGGALAIRSGTKRKRKVRTREDDITDEEEFLGSCHQDDEFIYPSLEASDEDGPIFKNRGRSKNDESWNPKARLLPNCPKPDRPVREGVRKEAVETGLAAAAARLAHLPPPKRPYHKKKLSKTKISSIIANKVDPQPGTSTDDTNIFDPIAPLTPKCGGPFKGKKPKKGFATAKQRLGRILKIHKMLH